MDEGGRWGGVLCRLHSTVEQLQLGPFEYLISEGAKSAAILHQYIGILPCPSWSLIKY